MRKQNTTYIRTVQQLERIFNAINTEYCDGRLEKPTITIQSSLKAYAHVSVSKVWKTSEGKESRELNISADYLRTSERDLENIVSSMAHEMAHIWNMDNGIKDVSGSGSYYHNKKFKKTAEEIFHLEIDHDTKYGWTITKPTVDTLELIDKYDLQPILINRDGGYGYTPTGTAKAGNKGTGMTAKKKGNSYKWQCPCCGTIVRSSKPKVNIICGDCNVPFEQA